MFHTNEMSFITIRIYFLHVKMGETTAASIHESATGIDSLDPNNNVEGNEAVMILI